MICADIYVCVCVCVCGVCYEMIWLEVQQMNRRKHTIPKDQVVFLIFLLTVDAPSSSSSSHTAGFFFVTC